MHRRPTRLALVLLMSLAVSCADDGSSNAVFECTTDDDCLAGWVCEHSPSHGASVCRERSDLQDTSPTSDTSDTSSPPPDIVAADTAVDTVTIDSGPDTAPSDTGMPDTVAPDPCDGLCTGTTTCCNGQCFNLAGSNLHCGACGRACTDGSSCCAGQCGGVFDDSCCPGVGWSNHANDVHNCGECGNDCRAGTCNGGTCETTVRFDGDRLAPTTVTLGVGHFVVFSNEAADVYMFIEFSEGPASGLVPPGGTYALEALTIGRFHFTERFSGTAGVVVVE